jgi:hypothetical protein
MSVDLETDEPRAMLHPQPAATQAAMAATAKQDYADYVHGIDAAIADCEDALKENPANARVRAASRSMAVNRSICHWPDS